MILGTAENYLKEELYHRIQEDPEIFEFIQSGSMDGLWYWDLENIENEWMSPKFWETLGYEPTDMKHMSSEWQDIIFPDDLKLVLDNLHDHCMNKTHPYDLIVRYRHKDGSTVWMRCRGMAIRDDKGNPYRMLGSNTDITDMKEKELALEKTGNLLDLVFNGTPDGMALLASQGDNTFRYELVNKAFLDSVGLPEDRIIGRQPEDVFGEKYGLEITGLFNSCLEHNRVLELEEESEFSGAALWFHTTITPVRKAGLPDHIIETKRMSQVT